MRLSEYSKVRLERRRLALDIDRQSWRAHWQDIRDLFKPRSSRYLDDDGQPNRGTKKHGRVIDNTALLALRTASSGLLVGMANPARPWFRLRCSDEDLMHAPGVRQWLGTVEEKIRQTFDNAAYYRALLDCFEELCAYGTCALHVQESPDKILRFTPYTIGSYWIAQDPERKVDTFYRQFRWQTRQIVTRFVRNPADDNHPDWGNISPAVKSAWRNQNLETWFEVINAIESNPMPRGIIGAQAKKISSVYYERGGEPDKLLATKGYAKFPVMVARWRTNEEDVWGWSPAMDCLGDARALQLQQKRKAQAIDKQIDPPLVGDPALRQQRVSSLPGDVTYVANSQNTIGLKPLYEVKPDISGLLADITETKQRVEAAMYTPVFKMFDMLGDRPDRTAAEIYARKEEKLQELGPVVYAVNNELLSPSIQYTFDALVARSHAAWTTGFGEMLIPPPPEALQNVALQIEYVSIVAQAMQLANVQGINTLADFAMKVAEVRPDVFDKINLDRSVEELGAALGVPADIMVGDDQVAQVRAQRAQQQQQQQEAEQQQQAVATASQAAKNLSGASVGDKSALEHLVGAAGQ